jgi:L-threonylcarbamoyladenylate synthase
MTAPILSIRDDAAVRQAARLIRLGELVVVPTDTIYGIVTLPLNQGAINHFYAVRQRDPEPALPFLIADAGEMARLARPTATAQRLARRFWPGLLTIILPPAADLPAALRAFPIALRVPNYPPLIPLLQASGGHLLTSGAIRSGFPPAITAVEAAELFGDDVALILDGGPAPYGVPSTILDCVPDPPVIVRRGALPDGKIWLALGLDAPPPATS